MVGGCPHGRPLAAFAWLRDSVQVNLRSWDEEIPVEPFAFADGQNRPTEFTVESIIDEVRFEYVLELNRQVSHFASDLLRTEILGLGAQLAFTSHDTSLLNHLNRDEVWLTEKLDNGSTRLGALAEFAGERVRSSKNLERGYMSGRFGALPDVDRTAFLRTLGLIG